MYRNPITEDTVQRVLELIPDHSVTQTALLVGYSRSTVSRIIREHRIKRSPEEVREIRAKCRTDLLKAERRRVIFGLEQKSGLKAFTNKDRISLRYCLKRKGYRFECRASNIACYDSQTLRDAEYERRGLKLGLRFRAIEDPA